MDSTWAPGVAFCIFVVGLPWDIGFSGNIANVVQRVWLQKIKAACMPLTCMYPPCPPGAFGLAIRARGMFGVAGSKSCSKRKSV